MLTYPSKTSGVPARRGSMATYLASPRISFEPRRRLCDMDQIRKPLPQVRSYVPGGEDHQLALDAREGM